MSESLDDRAKEDRFKALGILYGAFKHNRDKKTGVFGSNEQLRESFKALIAKGYAMETEMVCGSVHPAYILTKQGLARYEDISGSLRETLGSLEI